MSIGVLGPVAVDGNLAISRRDRVVLAVLALDAGRPIRAEVLAEALWEEPPPTWPKVVQGCILRLRRILGADSIETTPHGYRLAIARDDVDAHRFERLVRQARDHLERGEAERAAYVVGQALALWRGEALVDLEGSRVGAVEAHRLEDMRRDAEELAAEAALGSGRHDEILSDVRVLVEGAPTREHRWALLARAQFQSGRQDEALRTLRQARRVLDVELGLEPGPELVELEQAILRQDVRLITAASTGEDHGFCPYPGLVPFDVADVDIFFGRSEEIAACLARLRSSGVVAVVGPSGSGKSSLVRAGVAAALRRDGVPVDVVSPGPRPLDTLTTPRREGRQAALVVDQLEEIVLLCDDAAERDAFLDRLVERASSGGLVVAIRADRLAEICRHDGFARLVEQGVQLLTGMSDSSVREAVASPAQSAGLLLEPGLIDLVARDTQNQPGALPLLSHSLRMTWERREGRTLTVAGYREAGGIAGAVAQSAEHLYDGLPADQRPIVRDLLLRLVAPGADGELVRRRVSRAGFAADAAHEDVVDALASARLVTVHEDHIELAHEALARAWPRLAGWLADDVAGQRILVHLTSAATAWESMGRPDSELYRGARLAQAAEWLDRAKPDLTAYEREFLEASTAVANADLDAARAQVAREAASARRTRRLASGLAVLLAMTCVAAGLAIRFQRVADSRAADARAASTAADADRLAALSHVVGSLDLSLLLAAQAVRMSDSPDTRAGLLSALMDHRRAVGVTRIGHSPTHVALANDGRTLFFDYSSLVPTAMAATVGSDAPPQAVARMEFDNMAGSPTRAEVALCNGDLIIVDQRGAHRRPATRVDLRGFAVNSGYAPGGRLLYVLTVSLEGTTAIAAVDTRPSDAVASSARGTAQPVLHRYPLFRASGRVGASFSDDGSTAVAWEDDSNGSLKRATLISLPAGDRAPVALDRRDGHTSALEAIPGGVAQLWDDGLVTLYGPSGRVAQRVLAGAAAIHDVFVSPDGTWAATGGDDDGVALWDIDRATGRWSMRETLTGQAGGIVGIEFDAATTTLLTAGQDGYVISWDLSADAGFGRTYPGLDDRWVANRPHLVGDTGVMVEPTRPLHGLSDDAALGSERGVGVAATFVDVATGRVLDQVPVGSTGVGFLFGSSVSVDPGGRWIAVTSGFETTILDAATHDVVGRVTLPPPTVTAGSEMVWGSGWTRDGSKLLLGAEGRADRAADGAIVVIDPGTWQVERRIAFPGAPQTFTASPSGRFLAVSSELASQVRIIDPLTLETEHVLNLGGNDNAYDMAFSPNEHWLATGGSAGALHVFDTSSWRPAMPPAPVHDQLVRQVEWLPDSQTVVTASSDGTVSIFDTKHATQALTFPAAADQTDVFAQLVPSPTTEIVTLAGGQAGRRYPVGVDAWLATACSIAGRSLTHDEWARYLPGRPYEATCRGSVGPDQLL
jgi:DNA-binding SARP family transcriptional activator/WD40 repeat protein